MVAGVAPVGAFAFQGTSLIVNRMGYGAMQLAGKDGDKMVWGPPRDKKGAIRVLQEAIASGVNHIDTADFYGPHVTNRIIREALAPYPGGLVIVTKVGARRGEDGAWNRAFSREELTTAVHENLQNLGLDVLDVVNFRCTFNLYRPADGSIEEPLTALAELQARGLIRAIGLSHVTPSQIEEARRIVPIVCVQNQFNLAHRADDDLVDDLAGKGIAYVPYFPLGGFSPLHSATLSEAAERLQATPMQVALAWLLQRSPNMLVIPGTSSLEHLRENLAAARLVIPAEELAKLDVVSEQVETTPVAGHTR